MTKKPIHSNAAPPRLYGSPTIISKLTNVSNCIDNRCTTTPAGQAFRIIGTITRAQNITIATHLLHRGHTIILKDTNVHQCCYSVFSNTILLKGTLQLLEQQFRTGTQDPFQLMVTSVYYPSNRTF